MDIYFVVDFSDITYVNLEDNSGQEILFLQDTFQLSLAVDVILGK